MLVRLLACFPLNSLLFSECCCTIVNGNLVSQWRSRFWSSKCTDLTQQLQCIVTPQPYSPVTMTITVCTDTHLCGVFHFSILPCFSLREWFSVSCLPWRRSGPVKKTPPVVGVQCTAVHVRHCQEVLPHDPYLGACIPSPVLLWECYLVCCQGNPISPSLVWET